MESSERARERSKARILIAPDFGGGRVESAASSNVGEHQGRALGRGHQGSLHRGRIARIARTADARPQSSRSSEAYVRCYRVDNPPPAEYIS